MQDLLFALDKGLRCAVICGLKTKDENVFVNSKTMVLVITGFSGKLHAFNVQGQNRSETWDDMRADYHHQPTSTFQEPSPKELRRWEIEAIHCFYIRECVIEVFLSENPCLRGVNCNKTKTP